jgi:hypothetical protein
MLISHSLRCLFINIPKCASVSIKRGLQLELIKAPLWHCSWDEARQILGDEITESYFKFTMVRNPWDRVISAWKMFEQHQFRRQNKQYSLPEFLEVVTDVGIAYEARYQTAAERNQWERSIENIRHHTLPALHFYYGLADAQGEIKADFVGRFERLDQDLDFIAKKLGMGLGRVPHINPTRRDAYAAYYDSQSRQIVSRYYECDIEAFGYRFGGDGNHWQTPVIKPVPQD